MLPRIIPEIIETYAPLSIWESFYLRMRWRLCPYEYVETLLPGSGKILDFGCGYGMLSNLLTLKQPKRIVVGVDLSRRRIRIAKRSVKDRSNISFYCSDIKDLEKGQYDAVVMTDVLHHINDAKVVSLFRLITSFLSDNGSIIILEVGKAPLWKFRFTRVIDQLLNPLDSLHYRSMSELRHLLGNVSVKIENVMPLHKGLPLPDFVYLCKKDTI